VCEKFNPAKYAKRKWLSGCAERNALSGLLINLTIILAPAFHKQVPRAATEVKSVMGKRENNACYDDELKKVLGRT
jgi:hypothetical protein